MPAAGIPGTAKDKERSVLASRRRRRAVERARKLSGRAPRGRRWRRHAGGGRGGEGGANRPERRRALLAPARRGQGARPIGTVPTTSKSVSSAPCATRRSRATAATPRRGRPDVTFGDAPHRLPVHVRTGERRALDRASRRSLPGARSRSLPPQGRNRRSRHSPAPPSVTMFPSIVMVPKGFDNRTPTAPSPWVAMSRNFASFGDPS